MTMRTAHTRKAGPGRRHAEPKAEDKRGDKTDFGMSKLARQYLTKYASLPMKGKPHRR